MLRDQAFAATVDSELAEELRGWAARACEGFVSAPPRFYALRRAHATSAEIACLLRKVLVKRGRSAPEGSAWISILSPAQYEAAAGAASSQTDLVAGAPWGPESPPAASQPTPPSQSCAVDYLMSLGVLSPDFEATSRTMLLALRAKLAAGAS